jgi:excisionase family DNA binding protein
MNFPLSGTNVQFCGKLVENSFCRSEGMHKRKQPETPVEPLLLTIPQVSAMLGLGHSKIYDLIRQEGLPTVKFGTATRIPAEELKQWIKQRIA